MDKRQTRLFHGQERVEPMYSPKQRSSQQHLSGRVLAATPQIAYQCSLANTRVSTPAALMILQSKAYQDYRSRRRRSSNALDDTYQLLRNALHVAQDRDARASYPAAYAELGESKQELRAAHALLTKDEISDEELAKAKEHMLWASASLSAVEYKLKPRQLEKLARKRPPRISSQARDLVPSLGRGVRCDCSGISV